MSLEQWISSAQQIYLILLDFSKAFDTVPHYRLLAKLRYYGINNTTCQWIQTWLTNRSQCVLVYGKSSESIPVTSGVPQGTVLDPLISMILLQIYLHHSDCLLMTAYYTMQLIQRKMLMYYSRILTISINGHQPGNSTLT